FTELCSRGKLREAFASHFLLVWSKPKLVTHLLKASIGFHSVALAFQIHSIVVAGGWWKKKFVSNSLMHAYVKLGQIDLAVKVFDKMPERNIMSCNILIGGRIRNGELDAAVDAFNAMELRNSSTWNAIIAGLINVGRDRHGWALFAEMHSTGFSPDAYTLATVQRGCAGLKDLTRGKQIHCYAIKSGSEDDPVIGSTAHMYMRCSSLDDGEKTMNSITHRNTAAHNILIAGRVQNGDPFGALDQYRRIRSTGFRPDRITFASLVTSCSDLSTLGAGRQIHAEIVKSGTLHSPAVTSSLISMYSHCACLDDAEKVFVEREEAEDDFVTWSSMLAAYGFHGKGEEAIAIFEKMELKHMEASDVTFLSLLHACSHSGLKDEGRRYFDLMVKNYKLEPQVEHYTCMVDLLGRAGDLEEAESTIKSMASQPDKITWKTLLSACKIHRNTEMAERAAREILKIDPRDSASYVLLAHSQASAQQWLKSEEARRAMRNRAIKKKEPGMSWFETKNEFHCFVTGDNSHPQWENVVSYLRQLMLELKSNGYVPETGSVLHDMDSEEKEHNLVFHTEKLAVAFALMSNPPAGHPIRIMKNLRVCDDCHAAMKFISAVRDRAIIIRDIARFHRFENGSCSCRDYW
ncbi:hypothetical protein M569_03570, partial [Genlisea aurea]